jgi:hypothetical protein
MTGTEKQGLGQVTYQPGGASRLCDMTTCFNREKQRKAMPTPKGKLPEYALYMPR